MKLKRVTAKVLEKARAKMMLMSKKEKSSKALKKLKVVKKVMKKKVKVEK